MPRRRHQSKEVEEVLREAEAYGWEITTTGKGYWRALCPCGQHQKSIHLTPSTPYYANHLRQWFRRQSCWEEDRREDRR